jgi:hypothetical protein
MIEMVPRSTTLHSTKPIPTGVCSVAIPPLLPKHSLSFLVVGGGVAGLACAHRLAQDVRWGPIHVTLMERKDRFGGRVKTVQMSTRHTRCPAERSSTRTRTRTGARTEPEGECGSSPASSWYEAGASRIADSHHRVRRLAQELGCKEQLLPDTYDHHQKLRNMMRTFEQLYTTFCTKHPSRTTQALQAISWYELMTQVCSSHASRDALVEKWGFRSVLTEMNAYDFWHHAMPQYVAKRYYTLEGGLQTLPDKLLLQLKRHACVEVQHGIRVLGVQRAAGGKLRVSYQPDAEVVASGAMTAPKTTLFDMVFLALPAEELDTLRGEPSRYGHLWNAVSRNRLVRCYAKYRTPPITLVRAGARSRMSTSRARIPRRRANRNHSSCTTTRKNPEVPAPKPPPPHRPLRYLTDLSRPAVRRSILRKCTTTHDPQWVQLSYCDHIHADTLVDTLRLPKGLLHFRRLVEGVLGNPWGAFRDTDLDLHYWKHGTHSWKPQLAAEDHYKRCLQPDTKVPLFVVGSSLSHYGHWMEGALETVEDAYRKSWRWGVEWLGVGRGRKHRSLMHRRLSQRQSDADTTAHWFTSTTASSAGTNAALFLHHKCDHDSVTRTMKDVVDNGWVVLDGYVYDVSDIEHTHPGGSALIRNMRGKDLSVAYHRVGHSAGARAWIERYCKGRLSTP